MYETEANIKKESVNQIPAEIVAHFRQSKDMILARTVLPWSEHCTECVWPTCYKTCDLFSPREDGKCRRFADGMVRIDCADALNSYLLKIRFKQWGKLWTPGSIRLRSTQSALQLERRDHWIGTMLYQIPLSAPVKALAIQKRYSFKKRLASRGPLGESLPTDFMLECYNPSTNMVRLSLTMRAVDDRVKVPFQQLVELASGFHRIRILCKDINRFLDLRAPFNIELTPNENKTGTTLYFGLMDFVRETLGLSDPKSQRRGSNGPKTIKCIVWDLDNTVWDGILVEDGPAKLRLRLHIVDLIKKLDGRGILHSIVSKNNPDEALGVLRSFGIEEYFLCPQISWQPKSQGIAAVAQQLSIGIDTLLFVDDSEFELHEVTGVYPEVRVLNANRYLDIANRDDCQVEVTEESQERRKMYQVESQRQLVAENFADDYMRFLRYCNIRLNIQPMTKSNLARVHELTQRTNQMNFSGNKYQRSVLERILSTTYLDTYVLDVEDRFGSYGVVGFSIVDSRVPLMTDLMFSCRIQSKRVEHAFLSYLITKYIALSGKDFRANYRKSSRNAPSGKVFSDMLLHESGINDGVSQLVFPRHRQVPNDGIIDVVTHESAVVIRK
jgi:FkbH-like protein